MHRTIIRIILSVIALGIIGGCKNKLSPSDSEKHLKAFDSEIIMLSKQFSETCAFDAFQFLLAQNNVPIPFRYNSNQTADHALEYNFEQSKGKYEIDLATNTAFKTGESDSVIILIPRTCKNHEQITLIICDYAEEYSIWDMMIPTKAYLSMMAGNTEIMRMELNVEMKYQVPVLANLHINSEGIYLKYDMKTRLSKRTTRSKMNVVAGKNTDEIIVASSNVRMKQEANGSLLFDHVNFKFKAFPVKMQGKIDYNKIDSNTRFFNSQFNKHSEITIKSFKNKKIGKVLLTDRSDVDRLSFDIIYNDNSTKNMDELLLTLKTLLNVKI